MVEKSAMPMILAALLAGAIPGFLLVFNSVFSDGGSAGERLVTFVLTAAAYALLGLLFGYAAPGRGWRWGVWIALPALLILALYGLREPGVLLLGLGYLLLALGAGCWASGAAAGMRTSHRSILKLRRRGPPAVAPGAPGRAAAVGKKVLTGVHRMPNVPDSSVRFFGRPALKCFCRMPMRGETAAGVVSPPLGARRRFKDA
jgi:hypothetical protein